MNDSIVKALADKTPQFYDNSDSSILANRDQLIYTQLYPYMPVTSTFVDAQSYITISLGKFKAENMSVHSGWVDIYVISHRQVLSTEIGDRNGFLVDEIDEMMFATRGFGIGKIADRDFGEFNLGSEKDYIGATVRYYLTDFSLLGS